MLDLRTGVRVVRPRLAPRPAFWVLAFYGVLFLGNAAGAAAPLSPIAPERSPAAQPPPGGEEEHPENEHGHAADPQVPRAGANDVRRGSEHAHDGAAQAQAMAPEHAAHNHTHEQASEVHLTPQQRRILDLEVTVLGRRALGETLRAPGEVRLNAYATAQVTPRIEAQVTARHARLGEHVERGQPLVTLSSVDMAEAQGDLIVAERAWQRLTKLKDQFVSESVYLEASVARRKARLRVLAYGMTAAQADALVAVSEKGDGTFELLAPQSGTVIRDEFVLGELVEPGRVLFEITDESVRWVEARMPPEQVARVSLGDAARIAYRRDWLDGRVSQIHHLLDETTRTQAVRVEVPDPAHRLHPGVFVDVVILIGEGDPVLVVPEAAVLRSSHGDWEVFVTDGADAYRPVAVELVRTAGGMAIIEGLPAGTRVVTRGAFFLQSELAKSGFDPHSH